MSHEDPKIISSPISIWNIERSKKPRPRCGVKTCRKPLNVSKIEVGRVKVKKKRGPGRPSKKDKFIKGRIVIGYYCKHCHIFYYLDGTPNYKLRLIPDWTIDGGDE